MSRWGGVNKHNNLCIITEVFDSSTNESLPVTSANVFVMRSTS